LCGASVRAACWVRRWCREKFGGRRTIPAKDTRAGWRRL